MKFPHLFGGIIFENKNLHSRRQLPFWQGETEFSASTDCFRTLSQLLEKNIFNQSGFAYAED
jgi:hypothetical protein